MLLFLEYAGLVLLVVYLSINLSKYVDALDKKTHLSGAFIGGVLLAAVTSLPELFTSITSVLMLNQPNLVQGNVLGSNIFNLTVIGVCVFFASKSFKETTLSKSHLTTIICTIAMFVICFIGMYMQNAVLNLKIIQVNWASVLIIILYIVNLKKMNNDSTGSNEETCDINLTVKQIMVRFILTAAILVIVSILLTEVTDKIAERLNLGATVAGAVFLGVATSLPELTSSINLVRLKNFNASFGNIVGSNLFNFTILSLADILYNKGGIYLKDYQASVFIILGIISSIFTIFTLVFKKNTIIIKILGLCIILSYILSIVFSMQ